MVKVEAQVNGDHTDVSVAMEGKGIDIVNEAISVIQAVMGDLKKNEEPLHLVAIKAIADDPSILLGGDEAQVERFEKLMATAKFREGVN